MKDASSQVVKKQIEESKENKVWNVHSPQLFLVISYLRLIIATESRIQQTKVFTFFMMIEKVILFTVKPVTHAGTRAILENEFS